MNWRKSDNLCAVIFLVILLAWCTVSCNDGKVEHNDSTTHRTRQHVKSPEKKLVKIDSKSKVVRFYSDTGFIVDSVNLINSNPYYEEFSDFAKIPYGESDFTIDLSTAQLSMDQAKSIYSEDRLVPFAAIQGASYLRAYLKSFDIVNAKQAIVLNYVASTYNKLGELIGLRSRVIIYKIKDGKLAETSFDLKADAHAIKTTPDLKNIFFVGGGPINENFNSITPERIYRLNIETKKVTIFMEAKKGELFSSIAFDEPNWIRYSRIKEFADPYYADLFIYNYAKDELFEIKGTLPTNPPQKIIQDSIYFLDNSKIAVRDLKRAR